MALTVITPQDGNIVELGTFEEKAKLFYDVSADALLIQTPGSDLVLVDRVTIDNAGLVTFAGALTVTGAFIASGSLTMANAQNIIVNATTGTKIGTATTQKLGFWNATPVVQQVHVADPTDLASCIVAITAINAKDAALGLTAAA